VKSIAHYIIFISCLLAALHVHGQQSYPESEEDSLSNIIMYASTMSHRQYESSSIDTLVGDVTMTQDSLVMYCDQAIVYDEINAKAYDNVVIVHHDTIQIFADSMHYNGLSKIAVLFGEVILQDGHTILYTDQLYYDAGLKEARYSTGGTIISDTDTIISRGGQYIQTERKAILNGNVTFEDSVRIMRTDSTIYFADLNQINIVSPTRIYQDSIDIYCEGGVFRLKTNRGILSQNVQVQSDDQYLTSQLLDIRGQEKIYTFLIDPQIIDNERYAAADSIVFLDQEGLIELRSEAFYRSEEESLNAPLIIYDKVTNTYATKGRSKVKTDSRNIEANEIINESDDMTRLNGDVMIKNEDGSMQIEGQIAEKGSEKTKMFSTTGLQPLLTYYLEHDNLYLKADTLIAESREQSINDDEPIDPETSNSIQTTDPRYARSDTYSDIPDKVPSDSILQKESELAISLDEEQGPSDTLSIIEDKVTKNDPSRLLLDIGLPDQVPVKKDTNSVTSSDRFVNALPFIDTSTLNQYKDLVTQDTTAPSKIEESSTEDVLLALGQVKLMSGQTYGLADNGTYDLIDSIITLVGRPILWSESTQLTADTIQIYLRQNQVYRLSLISNAMIIIPDSLDVYNQISGRLIDNYLVDQEIRKSVVGGNASLLYLNLQDDGYKGINLSKSDQMTFTFVDGEIDRIRSKGQHESNLYEYTEGIDVTSYYLAGFQWRIEERPQSEYFAESTIKN